MVVAMFFCDEAIKDDLLCHLRDEASQSLEGRRVKPDAEFSFARIVFAFK
jgi:hypothetical protein